MVEIVSPGDESWAKLPFYAAREVAEVAVVDPQTREISWLGRRDAGYVETDHSTVVDVAVGDVVAQIAWPPPEHD